MRGGLELANTAIEVACAEGAGSGGGVGCPGLHWIWGGSVGGVGVWNG